MLRFLFLFCVALSCHVTVQAQDLARGADISWLSEMEASGRVWRDSNGVQKDLLDILPDYCVNSIRLRAWVDPSGGWSGKSDVVNLSKRAVAKGYRLMIDFHYSDSWADPGQQNKPAAWAGYTMGQLIQAVYDHTYDVLATLKTEGITPEWVQVGNETNDGMLWPEGRASANNANMVNYARFVDSGYQAVKDVFPEAKVLAHVANGYDNALFRWNIGGLVANNARFDAIAMSMYPESGNTPDWQDYAARTLANAEDMISRYGKEIMISEIGMPTNQPRVARQFVEQVIRDLRSIQEDKGLGVFWWEPQAYNWRGYGKVAWHGDVGAGAYQATEAMKGFQYNCQESVVTTVPTTFIVDMTGQDIGQGVYITGDMTSTSAGGDWRLLPMTAMGDNRYARTIAMRPGQTGAYYYLNGNDWSARETVPAACAVWWNVDRGYDIPAMDAYAINDAWERCESIITDMYHVRNERFKVYPNPFEDSFTLDLALPSEYTITSMENVHIMSGYCSETCEVGDQLPSGTYILRLKNRSEAKVMKLVKR